MDINEITDKAIDYMLPRLVDEAAADSPKLSEWEKTQFIPSIVDQWERRRSLSEKQKEILGRIWDKA